MKVKVGTRFPKAGDWCWHPDEENPTKIVLGLPSVGVIRIQVVNGPDSVILNGEIAWGWDGDIDSPTLNPSIDCKCGENGWHGYLKKGELIECGV